MPGFGEQAELPSSHPSVGLKNSIPSPFHVQPRSLKRPGPSCVHRVCVSGARPHLYLTGASGELLRATSSSILPALEAKDQRQPRPEQPATCGGSKQPQQQPAFLVALKADSFFCPIRSPQKVRQPVRSTPFSMPFHIPPGILCASFCIYTDGLSVALSEA